MRRLLPFIIGILLFVGLLASVPFLLRPDRYRAELTATLTQRLHHPVTLGKLDAGLFPPNLKINAFALQGADGKSVLQSDRIDVGLDWMSLFRFKVSPKSITLNKWSITVTRRTDGSWNCDEWLTPAQGTTGGMGWPIQSVLLKGGEVRFVDPLNPSGKELRWQSVDGDWAAAQSVAHLTATLASTALTVTAEGKGQFLSGDWSADVRLADDGRPWILQVQNLKGQLEVKGQAKEWRLQQALEWGRFYARLPSQDSNSGRMLRDWGTRLTWQGTSTSFYHTATIEGGKTEVSGLLIGNPTGLQVQLKGSVQELPVSVLEGSESPLLKDAKLNAMVTEFSMALSTRSWASLNAKGSFDLHNGSYRLPAASAKVLAKAKTLGYLKAKFPGFLDSGLPFDKVSALVTVTNGMATVMDGRLAAKTLDAAMAGKIDLASRGSDAYVRLQIRETDPAKIRLIPQRYIYHAGGRTLIQPMFGRLQGTWQEWILRAIPASKIPASTKSRLQQTLKN